MLFQAPTRWLSPDSNAALMAAEDSLSSGERTGRFYHPELDGLRFCACFAVFVFHLFGRTPQPIGEVPPLVLQLFEWTASVFISGQVGVDLFFVLSSYLITELLLREYQKHGTIAVKAFYIRRALRIWPLYFAFLVGAMLIEDRVLHNGGPPAKFALQLACFLGNWACVPLTSLPTTTAVILWTVSIEEQFYLVWPALLKWVTPRRLGGCMVGLIMLATVTRVILMMQEATYYGFNCNTFARLDSIGSGALLAVLLRGRVPSFKSSTRFLLAVIGFVLLLIANRYLYLHKPFPHWPLWFYPAQVIASVLFLLATLRPQSDQRGWLTWKPVVFLGGISYGIYVFHSPCLVFTHQLAWLPSGVVGLMAQFLIALILTIAAAVISYYCLERPFLKLKERFAVVAARETR